MKLCSVFCLIYLWDVVLFNVLVFRWSLIFTHCTVRTQHYQTFHRTHQYKVVIFCHQYYHICFFYPVLKITNTVEAGCKSSPLTTAVCPACWSLASDATNTLHRHLVTLFTGCRYHSASPSRLHWWCSTVLTVSVRSTLVTCTCHWCPFTITVSWPRWHRRTTGSVH